MNKEIYYFIRHMILIILYFNRCFSIVPPPALFKKEVKYQ